MTPKVDRGMMWDTLGAIPVNTIFFTLQLFENDVNMTDVGILQRVYFNVLLYKKEFYLHLFY